MAMPSHDFSEASAVHAAKARGDACLIYPHPVSGKRLLVSGTPEHIRLLADALNNLEWYRNDFRMRSGRSFELAQMHIIEDE